MNKDPEAGLPRPSSAFYRITSLPPPPPPPKDEGYRPNTASTRRFSRGTLASARSIKYAGGRFAGTELSPQPSDDLEDPLNWPQWKKELNLAALLLTTALSSATKTLLIPSNAQLASTYNIPYTSAAALTAAPLIVSAFSGLACVTAAKLFGKRPIYLASSLALFVGSVWGTSVGGFEELMAARVFQGVGWGAFDTLVLGSIYDTYFEHERGLRIAIYNILTTAITWGSPLLSGLASNANFTLPFTIPSALFALALPLMVLGTAESTFDHAWSVSLQTPSSAKPFHGKSRSPSRNLILHWRLRVSKEEVLEYLRSIPPWGYRGTADAHTLLQAPRALAAPTTVLVVAAGVLPHAALWALAGLLGRLFPSLEESSLGALMAGPFVLSTLVVGASRMYKPYAGRFNKTTNLATLVAGTVLSLAGILSFGLLSSRLLLSGGSVNYALLSFLLALLAGGSAALDAAGPPLLYASAQYTSSNLYSCLRNVADMAAGAAALRSLFAGVALQAVAMAVDATPDALARNIVGMAGGQVLVAAGVAGVWVVLGERVRRWDGRVMGLVDLSILKGNASFFEYD